MHCKTQSSQFQQRLFMCSLICNNCFKILLSGHWCGCMDTLQSHWLLFYTERKPSPFPLFASFHFISSHHVEPVRISLHLMYKKIHKITEQNVTMETASTHKSLKWIAKCRLNRQTRFMTIRCFCWKVVTLLFIWRSKKIFVYETF